jgi:hypothetical protein
VPLWIAPRHRASRGTTRGGGTVSTHHVPSPRINSLSATAWLQLTPGSGKNITPLPLSHLKVVPVVPAQ